MRGIEFLIRAFRKSECQSACHALVLVSTRSSTQACPRGRGHGTRAEFEFVAAAERPPAEPVDFVFLDHGYPLQTEG